METVSSENFDDKFGKILNRKKTKGIVRSNFNMEYIPFSEKVPFVLKIINQFRTQGDVKCVYKISYWEDGNNVLDVLQDLNIPTKYCCEVQMYKNGAKPGVIYIERAISDIMLSGILLHHFNFELGKHPSLNMQLQLWMNDKDGGLLFDFYDDRGFILYFL